MSLKSISFIKVIINIIMVISLIIMICWSIYLNNQNKTLNEINYELTTSINEQESTINKLLQDNKSLNDEITLLKNENNELQNNNLLKAQVQNLQKKDFKTYMSYKAITSQSSKQWQLQQIAKTNEDGIRCIDEIPMVAVGTGWKLSVGDIALVTCDNNNSFKVIIGDIKADIHTDIENKTTIVSNCRCEFIVETSKLNSQVKKIGSVSALSKYKGYVINIEKIGSYS